jgi:ribokinase
MIQIIGNAAVDTVIRLNRFPRPGETVVALGATDDLGGKGANQAVAAARCGAEVRLIAAVGADVLGDRIRASSRRKGWRRTASGPRPTQPTAASLQSTSRARI